MAFVDYEPIENGLTRELVAREVNIPTLHEWWAEQRTAQFEISTMISSLKEAGSVPSPALARKLGYVRISMGWISSRLEELGVETETPSEGKKLRALRHEITQLQQKLASANTKRKALQAHIMLLESALRNRGEKPPMLDGNHPHPKETSGEQ